MSCDVTPSLHAISRTSPNIFDRQSHVVGQLSKRHMRHTPPKIIGTCLLIRNPASLLDTMSRLVRQTQVDTGCIDPLFLSHSTSCLLQQVVPCWLAKAFGPVYEDNKPDCLIIDLRCYSHLAIDVSESVTCQRCSNVNGKRSKGRDVPAHLRTEI